MIDGASLRETGSRPTGQAPAGLDAPRFDPARDAAPGPFWLILTEQNFAIRFYFANGNYAMDFRVFEAAEGFYADSDVGTWGLFDGSESHELNGWESASWVIDGAVKWDGCINWQTSSECMMHGCGPSHPEAIKAIFDAVYATGAEFYDYLGDAPPKMPAGAIHIRDRDASLAEDAQRLSGEAVAARPEGIAQ